MVAMTEEPLSCPMHGLTERPEVPWACPKCGSTLRPAPDLSAITIGTDTIGRPRNLYRFPELLPIRGAQRTGEFTGWTPLVRAERLGAMFGLNNLYLKLDCYNWPSYSYKDRVVASALQRALECGYTTIGCVSTGNVGNSVAALAAAAGMRAVVFYPSGIEAGKNLMSLQLGATVIQLDGSFDDVNKVCRTLALETDIPFVNLNLRPYYAEGAKTIAYEIVEQLGWNQPDHVIAPAAGAALLSRMAFGFEEMSALGMTRGQQWARIHAAQAAGCAPIANAYAAGETVPRPCVPDTDARSIAIGNPSDGAVALDVIARSSGSAHAIPDAEIVEGIGLLGKHEGIYTEHAGGAAIAALHRLVVSGKVERDERVVAVISGSGLKTEGAGGEVLQRIVHAPADAERVLGLFAGIVA